MKSTPRSPALQALEAFVIRWCLGESCCLPMADATVGELLWFCFVWFLFCFFFLVNFRSV